MQKINSNMFLAPLFPAVVMSVLAGIETKALEQLVIVFFMWSITGILSLLLFGLPLILVIRRFIAINFPCSILIAVVSAELMTLIIAFLVPGRFPWYVGFNSMSLVNIPCGIVGGISLWYFGFKKVNA
jgi:hypothetical protein